MSKDPILFGGEDTNLYGYVFQDPINFIDTNGNFAIPLILPLIPILTNAAIATAKITAAAIAAYALSKSLPIKGPPNGSEVLPDNNGGKKQERFYDGNGNPIKAIDWSHDHGAGRPHIHDWIPRPGQPPKRGPGRPPGQGECS